MLIRTKFIDERVLQAIENGAKQFVILGAGFDTPAYRFADSLQGVKVFEVDGEATRPQAAASTGGAWTRAHKSHICNYRLQSRPI